MLECQEKRYALIIDGESLTHIMDDDIERFLLTSVCKQAVTVLGCRMSPLQKAHVSYWLQVILDIDLFIDLLIY